MGNNDTGVTWPPGNFGDDGWKKAKKAIWKRWLEKGFWDYKDAIHLTACGPCRFINTECTHEVDGIPDYYHECFEHSGQKSYEIYDLYKSEDWSKYGFPENEIPLRIKPEKFIEWVLSKKTIIVPQEMKSWYESHQAEKKTPAQGGSNKEVDKISATEEACKDEFLRQVQAT
jgi:hypothetical protein